MYVAIQSNIVCSHIEEIKKKQPSNMNKNTTEGNRFPFHCGKEEQER